MKENIARAIAALLEVEVIEPHRDYPESWGILLKHTDTEVIVLDGCDLEFYKNRESAQRRYLWDKIIHLR